MSTKDKIDKAAELYRKMQYQAGCLANEGKTWQQIDAATLSKLTEYNRLRAEIAAEMMDWARA